ncbi:MAG: hypothetical protein PVJ39_14700 [Gammaproteobacteria bacterium]|jgi:hypothetical protein
MADRVCKSCGYVGKAEHQSWGTFFVDAFMWLIFGSLTLFSGLLFVLFIPLAWTIYHLALFGNTQCPKCKSLDMVSKRSHKGKAVLKHEHGFPEPWTEKNHPAPSH